MGKLLLCKHCIIDYRMEINMRLIVKLLVDGTYRAYFDRLPNFYGKGNTRDEAVRDLTDKTKAVLAAIANIQHGA